MARSGSAGGTRPKTSGNDDQKAKDAAAAAAAAADEATKDAEADDAAASDPAAAEPKAEPKPDAEPKAEPTRREPRFAALRLVNEPAQVGAESYVVDAAFSAAGIQNDHELTIAEAQRAVAQFLQAPVKQEEGR